VSPSDSRDLLIWHAFGRGEHCVSSLVPPPANSGPLPFSGNSEFRAMEFQRTSQNKGLDGRRRHERREVSEERGRQVRYGERAWLRPRLHLRGVELSVVVGQRPPRGPRFQPVQLRRSGGIDGVRAVTRGSLSSARRRSGSGRQQLRGARRRNVGSELCRARRDSGGRKGLRWARHKVGGEL
jgi:hypothetical protein